MTALKTARLIFAGGGTGGHLYPAIAIADRVSELLKDRMEVKIVFVGTKRGLEYRVKDSLKYPLVTLSVRGIARSFTFDNLLVPFALLSSIIKASSLVRRFSPQVVVGTGGYVSWPVLTVASWQKIPTVLQEQNSFPGITTRKMAPKASRIYLGFAKASDYLRTKAKIMVTGNPVRTSVGRASREEGIRTFQLDPNKKTILVLGGSQGALAVNRTILRALENDRIPEGYQLLWQVGKRDYTDVVAAAGDKAKGHALFPFENRMDLVYAAADIAIARAGALTLAELQASATPAVLIPYPYAAGDHQRKNAEEFARQGFAIVIDERDFPTADPMNAAVEALASGQADTMCRAMRTASENKKPAVDVIAEDIINLITAA